MTTDAICEERGSDWSHQVSVVATAQWLQCDHTLPPSVKGVACKSISDVEDLALPTHKPGNKAIIRHTKLEPRCQGLFSFPSHSVHTGRNKMQCESRAIQILHKIQYQQNYSGVLLISHTNEEL